MRAKRVAATVAAGIMAAAAIMSGAAPAWAATQYEELAGTTTPFKKYLIIPAGANVPNVSFSYTVSAGEAVSPSKDDNAVFQVLPGPDADKITVTDTTFSKEDTASAVTEIASGDVDVARAASERAEGKTADTGVEFETEKGEKYVKKEATIDLSGVKFNEPGIYRYKITETASSEDAAAGIIHDDDVDRVLDVYVTDDGNGNLVLSQYVIHTDITDVTPAIGEDMGPADVENAGERLEDKTDGFTNEYKTKDIDVKKAVTGATASRDQYFKFTLKLENLNPNGKYDVSIADDGNANTADGSADAKSGTTAATKAEYQNKDNPTEFVADESGSVTKDLYLQHGQHIVVRGLPLNASYELTEDAEDYKSEASKVTDYTDPVTGVIGTVAGSNSIVKTSYLNTRGGIVPAGIPEVMQSGLVLIASAGGLGAAGIFFGRKRRRDDKD